MRSVLVSLQLMRKAMPSPRAVHFSMISVNHRPIELAFLGFEIRPRQPDVKMVHAGEFQQVGVAGDLILVGMVVREVVVPAFVRIDQDPRRILKRREIM